MPRRRLPSPGRSPLSSSLLGWGLCALLALGAAQARTVKIIEAQTLELRNLEVPGPDGTSEKQEFIVISGPRVELRLDDSTVVARRVEFNKTRRTLTLVGPGKYTSVSTDKSGKKSEQTLEGDDLVVNLADEGVEGEDVLVSTAQLDIRGETIQRIPGQIKVDQGYFTPCGKCGETPNDYAFRARELTIYPGDRLVAYDVQILLADEPVFYLPVLIFFLGDAQSKPVFEIGRNDKDGFTARADLPYVLGDNAYGFTLLRLYQNRDPFLGFGATLNTFDVLGGIGGAGDTLRVRALLTPRPTLEVTPSTPGTPVPASSDDFLARYLYDYRLTWKGKLDFLSARGLDFDLAISRTDSDGKGGVNTNSLEREITSTQLTAKSTLPDLDLSLSFNDQYDHNMSANSPEPKIVRKRPELELDFKAWRAPLGLTGVSVDSKLSLGLYSAPVNPANRSARDAAQEGILESARLEAQYTLGYTSPLWEGATFDFNNSYTGRFYTSQNPAIPLIVGSTATPERNVNVTLSAGLSQKLADRGTFQARYEFSRQEGESPFLFDAPPPARSTQNLSGNLTVTPSPWLTLSASQIYNLLEQKPERQNNLALTATANLERLIPELPLSLTASQERNLFVGELPGSLERWNLSATYLKGGLSATSSLGWQAANPLRGLPNNRFDPLVVQVGYQEPSGSLRVNFSQDIETDTPIRGSFEAIGLQIEAPAESRLRVDASEDYDFQARRVVGKQGINYGDTRFEVSHNFLLDDGQLEPNEDPLENIGTLLFSLGSSAREGTGSNSWSLSYGGAGFDLERDAWKRPTLSGSFNRTALGQNLSAGFVALAPGLDDPDWDLSSVSLDGGLELVSERIAFQGKARYTRNKQGETVEERIEFSPAVLTLALGDGPRPGAYLSGELRQTFVLRDGKPLPAYQPLQPILRLTIDRCCWVLRSEINLAKGGFKISLGLPDGKNRSLLEVGYDDTSNPKFPIIDTLFGGEK